MYSGVESFPIGIAYQLVSGSVVFAVYMDKCKKLNSLKHLVRTTVAGSHNENSKYEKGAIT